MRNTGNLLKWTQNSNNKSAKGGGKLILVGYYKTCLFMVTFFKKIETGFIPLKRYKKVILLTSLRY